MSDKHSPREWQRYFVESAINDVAFAGLVEHHPDLILLPNGKRVVWNVAQPPTEARG